MTAELVLQRKYRGKIGTLEKRCTVELLCFEKLIFNLVVR